VKGDAVNSILDVAETVAADLVVAGSKGMHGTRRFLGSVPNSVSHGASCAVLIVKTD
jgi:nucleotide-binding universal stress UspA family protein